MVPRRSDRRLPGPGPYIRGLAFREGSPPHADYPFVPAVRALAELKIDPRVTLLAGENGSGKSTLIEAIALASGFSSQGGSLSGELGRAERLDHGDLAAHIELEHGSSRPRIGFFLRAESFFNIASSIDGQDLFEVYGGRPLHDQSHGESFLALAANRFGSDGLFILDEPEAALSVTGQLALIAVIHRAAREGSQFILATHSPILLSYPGAAVYELTDAGLARVEPADTDAVRLTRDFIDAPGRFLRHVIDE
jgi:predicted ATPase